MKTTRVLVLAALLGSLAFTAPATAQFVGVVIEPFDRAEWFDNGYAGLTTYRIYGQFEVPGDADDGVLSGFGDFLVDLTINSSNGLFHNANINSSTAPLDLTGVGIWENQWDTYVTIGTDTSTGDATAPSPGFETETNGLASDFTSGNVGWFVTPGDDQRLTDADGRVMIAQFSVAEGECVFGIMNVLVTGPSPERQVEIPFSSCEQPPTGACCDRDLLECTDGVLEADCQFEWTQEMLCADLDPICEPPDPTGACCDRELLSCEDGVLEADCLDEWTQETLCADLDPICEPPDPTGACCDRDLLECTDSVLEADCQFEWTQETLCADLDPICEPPEPTGACCDRELLSCEDGVFEADCLDEWTQETLCADLDPICEPQDPTGACCDRELLECSDGVLEADCQFEWTQETLCADLDPICEPQDPTGACCDRDLLECTDGVLEADCQFEWTQETLCADLDPICATAQAVTVVIEPFDRAEWFDNGYTGLSTFRIYAQFPVPGDPEDGVLSGFADFLVDWTMQSSNGLFHNDLALGGLTAPLDLTGVGIWSNQWDTYVTIGTDTSTGDATSTSPGFAGETNDLGSDFTTSDAGWFVTPDDDQHLAGDDGRVLLAQFSVAEGECVSGIMNLLVTGPYEERQELLSFSSCGGPPTGACCNRDVLSCEDGILEEDCPDEWTQETLCEDLDPICEPAEPTGACCDRELLSCEDGVLEADCLDEWTQETLCADLDPICEPPPPTGACCDRELLSCEDGVLEADCQDEWTQETLCEDLDPICEPPPPTGACCDRELLSCEDGVLETDCLDEWTQETLCADLDPICEPPPPTGACCDRELLSCEDGVLEADCLDEWTQETLCEDLDPICEPPEPTGACCDRDVLSCEDGVLEADCLDEWTQETLCEDLDPICEPPEPTGACCDRDLLSCEDGVLEADCLDEWTQETLCEDLDPICEPGPIVVLPDGFEVVVGTLMFGGLEELFASDDDRMMVRSGGAMPAIQVEFQGTLITDFASSLSLTYESSSTAFPVGGEQRLAVFNFATADWDLVDSRPATSDDSVVEVTIDTNPDDYIAEDGTVRARVMYFGTNMLIQLRWAARVDQVFWTIAP